MTDTTSTNPAHGDPVTWFEIGTDEPAGARAFYGELFGWDFAGPGPGDYFVARLRGRDVAGVGAQPAGGGPPVPAWNTYVAVDSADEATARAADEGGDLVTAPFDAL